MEMGAKSPRLMDRSGGEREIESDTLNLLYFVPFWGKELKCKLTKGNNDWGLLEEVSEASIYIFGGLQGVSWRLGGGVS